MTEREFIFSGCENYPSEFHLKNGKTIYGIIIKYAIDSETQYHFVTNANVVEFKKHIDARDRANMKRLSSPISLEDILTAKRTATADTFSRRK